MVHRVRAMFRDRPTRGRFRWLRFRDYLTRLFRDYLTKVFRNYPTMTEHCDNDIRHEYSHCDNRQSLFCQNEPQRLPTAQ